MLNKSIIFITMLFTQTLLAMPIPNLPTMPIFSDFEPKVMSQFYNWLNSQPDFNREKRVVSEIEDSILDGDVEYLTLKNGAKIFSIYTESEADNSKGGVIILHNRGQHANWADTIKPMRIGLTKKGWDTLSVQMPVLGKQAKYYDYVPIFPYAFERIKAAIDFYKKRGVKNIILIAHGCGAHMAMGYFDQFGDEQISRFVGIGMGATDYGQKMIKPYPLERLKIPVLDIFAEHDFKGVLWLSKIRKPRLNAKSTQIEIKNADHYYQQEDLVEQLITQINTWLTR